jgi:hypothetical protein
LFFHDVQIRYANRPKAPYIAPQHLRHPRFWLFSMQKESVA